MPEARSRQTTGTRRRSTVSGQGAIVTDLTASVNELIRQNKALKAQLARFTGGSGWTAAPQRQLVSLQRRVMGAMAGVTTTTRTPRVRGTTTVVGTRRKITDPEILEKRRASLAKARAARSAKARTQSRGR